jgi:hypothetical protein
LLDYQWRYLVAFAVYRVEGTTHYDALPNAMEEPGEKCTVTFAFIFTEPAIE